MERDRIPIHFRTQVLHEAAYQCSNPICRTLITLDIHHIERISENGKSVPDNLIALCPNCHRRYHAGEIPVETIKSWKYHLLALNEAFDKKSINYLLLLNKVGSLFLRSDGLLEFAGLIASGNVIYDQVQNQTSIQLDHFNNIAKPILENGYKISLSAKGQKLIENWINGQMTKDT
jgi:hypothetical protein